MSQQGKLSPHREKLRSQFHKLGKLVECPIWPKFQRNQCWEIVDGSRDMYHYWSPRAGGAFSLSGSIADCMNSYLKNDEHKMAFSRWVYEKNSLGVFAEALSHDIPIIISQEQVSILEKMRFLLTAHAEITAHPSQGIFHNGSVYAGAYEAKLLSLARTSCLNQVEYSWLHDAAIQNGDLEIHNGHTRITPSGLAKIEKNANDVKSNQAFVAMWFNEAVDPAFENAIEVAVKSSGYSAYRDDRDRSHSDQITNKILAEIKNSKFLIADFTHGKDGARGGVYFEAGYAMGLGIPVIWTIRNDDTSKMHFDTNHYPHIFWETEEQLRDELEAAIIAHQHIGRGSL